LETLDYRLLIRLETDLEVRSMNFFKFEFLPSNFLLRKLCASLWLNLAGLVDDDIIIFVWKFGFNTGVKTTCSNAIEKSISTQGLKPPAPLLLKNRRLKPP
jgi:hypothetical protein